MNKRVFGSNISAVLNLPHQNMVLEIRKIKEEEIHKKEKKEKKLKKLKKQQNTILKKFKGVKKLQKGAKSVKEQKFFNDELERLNLQFQNIFTGIQSLNYS